MSAGEHKNVTQTKEFGLDKQVMNSIALYIYHKDYDPIPNVLDIFNDWAEACNISISNLETLANIIEYIRKLSKIKRTVLEKALNYDGLL